MACLRMQSSPRLVVQSSLNSDASCMTVLVQRFTGRVLAAGHIPGALADSVQAAHDMLLEVCVPSHEPCTNWPALHVAEQGRHAGMVSSLPVEHCCEPSCTLRYWPSLQLQRSQPCLELGSVTILEPGWQKQSASDNASTSVSVMPPPAQLAHWTYSSALALAGSSSDVRNSLEGLAGEDRGIQYAPDAVTRPMNSKSLYMADPYDVENAGPSGHDAGVAESMDASPCTYVEHRNTSILRSCSSTMLKAPVSARTENPGTNGTVYSKGDHAVYACS